MQTDLFGANSVPGSQTRSANPVDFLEKYRFSLRLDHALVSLIGFVIVYVLVFSFGVEQGKRFAMAELKAERAKHELMVDQLRDKIFVQAPQAGVVLEARKPEMPVAASLANAILVPADGGKVIPAAASVAAAPVQPARPAGKFTIQMVTFTSKQAAEKAIQDLAGKGLQAFSIPSGRFQQICLNGFESKAEAGQALKQFRAEGVVPKDAFVRPVPQAS